MPSSTSSSENTYPAPKTAFFDPEHVERPVPEHPWRPIVFGALAVTFILTLFWEIYWRANWHIPGDFKNTAALWSQERRKAKGDATVLIGSSRIFFDIDLNVWEDVSGVRPIQLALEGTSPAPFLADLADDEEFTGDVIVGVTTPILFTGYAYRDDVLKYYREESPSQRIGHILSKQYDKVFAYFDEQTRPRRMLFLTELPLRDGMEPRVDVRKLEIHDEDRNTEIWARIMEDEEYRELAKFVWAELIRKGAPPPNPDGSPPAPMPDEAINGVITEINASVEKIRSRGGEVSFFRLPYEGAYTDAEDFGFPRERFWDRLIEQTNAIGIAWQDYPQLQGYYLPEWSHLSPEDAERYTREIVPLYYSAMAARSAPPQSEK